MPEPLDEPMTQYRAIPIEWGLSKNPYHKFLMWVAFQATFNGWGRCDALQVTFSARQAAEALGCGKSTVSEWTVRAKAEGLLKPTQSFLREAGKGEVYDLDGEMLQTVKRPGQAPDKARTSSGQPEVGNTATCDESPDKLRTSSGQAPDAYKVYSPDSPVTPTTISASKKPRRSLKEKLESLDGYSDEATRIIRACCEFWPVDNGESRKLKEDPFTAAARVDEILKEYHIDGGLLIESARKYIEKMRGSGSTKFIKCLHFYFGPGKQGVTPTWSDEVKALNHERKNNV